MLNLEWLARIIEWLAGILKFVLNFEWLAGVPMTVARWVFLGLFILIGALVWRIPADYVFAGVKQRRWWLDLRWWGTGTLAMIFVTYALF